MKKFMSVILALFAVVACSSPVEDVIGDNLDSRVTDKDMEALINDLLAGVCTPNGCEVMDDNECVKPWNEGVLGNIHAKFSDFGLGKSVVFYNDGTCKMGYTINNNQCPVHGSRNYGLSYYDTWQWRYDLENCTITLIAEDLGEKYAVNTVKVLSYKDGVMLIDGKWPNSCIVETYSYTYTCRIDGANERAEFEASHVDEKLYPCCCTR